MYYTSNVILIATLFDNYIFFISDIHTFGKLFNQIFYTISFEFRSHCVMVRKSPLIGFFSRAKKAQEKSFPSKDCNQHLLCASTCTVDESL